MLVYLAHRLLPVASPPLSDAAFAVEEGKIVAVGSRRDVLKRHAAAEVRQLGQVAVFPGLVNAHTHVELSWMESVRPEPRGYTAWVRSILTERDRQPDEGTRRAAAAEALRCMVARGTVALGDVSNGAWVAAELARSGLAGVAFHEIYSFLSTDAEGLLEEAAQRLDRIESEPDVRAARGRILVVLTPHAPHTTSPALLKALAGRAVASAEPLSIHLAESDDEVELLRSGQGPFADLLRERKTWDEAWRAPGLSPIEYADRLGILSPRTLVVHCVHVDHQGLSKLQSRGVTVVTCPRSNRRLGVGKCPVGKILASGIPVALGTDSLASAPDLDLIAEMAALREEHPELAPAAVLRMATLNGARALSLAKELGSIEVGKRAALLVVALEDARDDPLEVVTAEPGHVFPLESAPWEPVTR